MPGSQHGPSILNPRVYEALRRKGMSKRRAAMISNAQRHKDSGITALAIPPHGPNALFNQPGTGGIRSRRRLKRRTKAAPNWGAKKGQTIAGNLKRGEGGRFEGGGGAATPPAKAGGRERRAALRAKRQARSDDTKAAREADRQVEESKRAEEDAYIAAGKTGRERQKRRAEIAAARRDRAAERRKVYAQEAADERARRAQEDADEQAAVAAEPKGGGGGGGGKKPKPTDEQKRAEQDKKKAQNRSATAPKAGLSTAEADFLAGAASGTLPPGSFDAKHLTALGLVQDTGDTTEATDAGRRALSALERGDVRGALAAIQDGKARLAREAAQAQRARERDAAKKKREAEQAKKKVPPPTTMPVRPEPKPDPAQSRALANQIIGNLEGRRGSRSTGRRIGGITNVERRLRRRKEMTQQTFGGTKRSALDDSVFAGPDRSFPIKTAQDVRDAARSLGRTKHDKAAVRRGIIRRARAIGAMDALPESWREKEAQANAITVGADGSLRLGSSFGAPGRIAVWDGNQWRATRPSFSVFKDASGRDRWLAITTTAYEDKDQEWITCKAIASVVTHGDAEPAARGPLRFWHVPGLDLGDCDYQASAFNDRVLIESGTFRSKAAARIGQAAAARGYQMSPGFLHTRRQPLDGRFDDIVLFERSFVPPGRASNPYTALLTKEARMLTDEKKKEFATLASDPESRTLLESLLAQAETTVKEADAAGAVYKDAPPWAQALIARLGALEATVKAPMPPAAMEEAGTTELDDGALDAADELAAEPDGDEGMMDDDGFADLIVQKLLAALGPMLDLEKKMAGWASEIKGMLPNMAQKDDARAKELADLQARIKELEGDQPRAARPPSMNAQAWAHVIGQTVTKEQAAQLATVTPGNQPPAGLESQQERDAYALIFGDQ